MLDRNRGFAATGQLFKFLRHAFPKFEHPFDPIRVLGIENRLRASLRGVAVLCSQRSSLLPYLLIAPVCCRPPEDSSLGFSPR